MTNSSSPLTQLIESLKHGLAFLDVDHCLALSRLD